MCSLQVDDPTLTPSRDSAMSVLYHRSVGFVSKRHFLPVIDSTSIEASTTGPKAAALDKKTTSEDRI
jgi:hypothetical protein